MLDLFSKPADQVSAGDIDALIELQIQEGTQIEFKEGLSTKSGSPDPWVKGEEKIGDYARNSILREVVAFANAYGGTLLLGIKETKSQPAAAAEITPLPRGDELADRLRKQLRDCVEPQIPQLEIFGVKTEGEAGVVVIRVGQSRMAPHRIKPTRSCLIRRADRSEEMSMREIQELVLNVSRGMERFDKRMKERSERFREVFGWLDSSADAFGLRLTAIPLGEEIVFERAVDKGTIIDELRMPRVGVTGKSSEGSWTLQSPVDFPATSWRPILRGVRADINEYGLKASYTGYQELGCDGLVELGFAASSKSALLHPDWPLVLFANLVTWTIHVRSKSPAPLAEYGVEVEIQTTGDKSRVGDASSSRFQAHLHFAAHAAKTDGNERELDRVAPRISNVRFPRYSLGATVNTDELLSIFRRDFWHWLRVDTQGDGVTLEINHVI